MLDLDAPHVARLEYQLELEHADGTTETVPDPGNPHRAPGAFGEKSVMLTDGYEPPAWLDRRRVEGDYDEFAIRGRGLGAHVQGFVWSPATWSPPSRCRCSSPTTGRSTTSSRSLTRYSAPMIAAGALPPHRVALLSPGPRDEWYSASALYARALYIDVIPGLREPVGVARAPVGMGASLGGLAMLFTQRRAPHRSPACSCSRAASSSRAWIRRSRASAATPASSASCAASSVPGRTPTRSQSR